MKRILILLSVLALLVAGIAWLARRKRAAPPPDESPTIFACEQAGAGRIFSYQGRQAPLRSLRWVPARGEIQLIAQMLTQQDEQRIAMFRDGVLVDICMVPFPAQVPQRFCKLAELVDAYAHPGGILVLLYATHEEDARETSLILAMDLKTRQLLWCHRAPGKHLVPSGKTLYVFAPASPLLRLPLEPTKKDDPNRAQRPSAVNIELPPEITEARDCIATPEGLLVAHTGGLSAYLNETETWNHVPPPETPTTGITFPDVSPSLASHGDTLYWQPRPGLVIQVEPDGTRKALWDISGIKPESWERDGALLKLLGVDAKGALWFAPVAPTLVQMPPPLPPEGQDTPPPPTPPVDPSANAAWDAYVQQGLDRLYRLETKTQKLQCVSWGKAWPSLGAPSTFMAPMSPHAFAFTPIGLLFEQHPTAWLLSLDRLPVQSSGELQPR